MSGNLTHHPGETLPYECDDCSTRYRYAIAAAMCCDPAAYGDDD